MNTARAADLFLTAKTTKGLSSRTLETYRYRLGILARRHAKLPTDPETLERFLLTTGPSIDTRETYYRLLRNLYRWLKSRRHIRANPVAHIEAPAGSPAPESATAPATAAAAAPAPAPAPPKAAVGTAKTPAPPPAENGAKKPQKPPPGGTNRTGFDSGGRSRAGAGRLRFTLPSGKKLRKGDFPEIIEWEQGKTIATRNLFTGGMQFRANKARKPRTPRRSLRVIQTTRRRPPRQRFRLGFEDVSLDGDALRFRLAKSRASRRDRTFSRARGI